MTTFCISELLYILYPEVIPSNLIKPLTVLLSAVYIYMLIKSIKYFMLLCGKVLQVTIESGFQTGLNICISLNGSL